MNTDFDKERKLYTKILNDKLKGFSEFEDWLRIVRKNSSGDFCVIGGFVYRSIIEGLYGFPNLPEKIDIDFLADNAPKEIYLPEGWSPELTRYGDLRLSKDKVQIDINLLPNFRRTGPISEEKELKIKYYWFGETPLNIQSIAYDVKSKEVFGSIGIKSIKDKLIKVNDYEEASNTAKRAGLSVEEFLMKKASELGFDYFYEGSRRSPKKKSELIRTVY